MNLNKKADVTTLYELRPDAGQSCANCAHRQGKVQTYWKCVRTGYFTDIEMKFGGRCAQGNELRLWAPRPEILSPLRRAMHWLLGKGAK